MPQLTIDFPESVMPRLTRQAENENTTPESYLISRVLDSMKQDESCVQECTDLAKKQLEDILEERDKGPFFKITDLAAYRQNLRSRVVERVEQYRHA